jgi:hypothetical protein
VFTDIYYCQCFIGAPSLLKKNLSLTYLPQIIFGPMFSGKTTELIRRLKRYEVANHKCLIVKVIFLKNLFELNFNTNPVD